MSVLGSGLLGLATMFQALQNKFGWGARLVTFCPVMGVSFTYLLCNTSTSAGASSWVYVPGFAQQPCEQYLVYLGTSRIFAPRQCSAGRDHFWKASFQALEDAAADEVKSKFELEQDFVAKAAREGATQAFADGSSSSANCRNDDMLSGRSSCGKASVCCGLHCSGVCKNCAAARTSRGGYCMCYPTSYLSNGRRVKHDGACVLPPGEEGNSVPSVDRNQPDHMKGTALHGAEL